MNLQCLYKIDKNGSESMLHQRNVDTGKDEMHSSRNLQDSSLCKDPFGVKQIRNPLRCCCCCCCCYHCYYFDWPVFDIPRQPWPSIIGAPKRLVVQHGCWTCGECDLDCLQGSFEIECSEYQRPPYRSLVLWLAAKLLFWSANCPQFRTAGEPLLSSCSCYHWLVVVLVSFLRLL